MTGRVGMGALSSISQDSSEGMGRSWADRDNDRQEKSQMNRFRLQNCLRLTRPVCSWRWNLSFSSSWGGMMIRSIR